MAFLRHVYQKNTQLPCSRTLKVKVIFPCYNELDIAFVTHDKDTVHDFIAYIWEQASKEKQLLIPFPMEEINLLHDRTELLLIRGKPLRHYLIVENDVFYLIKNISESSLNAVEYHEFIRYSYPGLNGSVGMSTIDFPSTNGSIVIKFGSSHKRRSAVCLYTAALVDCRVLQSAKTGDMVTNLGGNIREARKRGYVSWTDKDYTQRIYLLRLSDEASMSGFSYNDFTKIERVRYSTTGVLNRGYDGGDSRSWQRYTTDQPIPCEIEEKTVFEYFDYQGQMDAAVAAAEEAMALEALMRSGLAGPGQGQELGDDSSSREGGGEGETKEKTVVGKGIEVVGDDVRGDMIPPVVSDPSTDVATDGEEVSIITVRPMVPLEPDRYYAVLLANGVPLVPYDYCMMGRGDLFAFAAGNTTEDLLIVFKTAEMR